MFSSGESTGSTESSGSGSSNNESAVQNTSETATNPKLRPEEGYFGSKKHGIEWTEGPAQAKNPNRNGKKVPQGQWGSVEDLEYAGEKAATLKSRQGAEFPLPEGNKSVVHMPDGSTQKATHIWVRNNGNGTFHGYPMVK